MATGWIRYVYAALLLVGAAGVSAGVLAVANSVGDPIVKTRQVAQPALTARSSVADVRGRFDQKPQTMPGAQAGPAVAESCPQVDVYQARDGAVLICHN